MPEEFGRPIQIRSPQDILEMIANGRLDGVLDLIEEGVRVRRNNKREDILAKVREEFGPEAALSLVRDHTPSPRWTHTGQPTETGCDDPECPVPTCQGQMSR